ncbi:MAG: riboflavin synthase [Opitutales bacterium]
MFTGLIEETGEVLAFGEEDHACILTLHADRVIADDGLAPGDSLAVNGCCLTVARIDGPVIGFDLLGETVRLTSFRDLAVGSAVNLERSLLPTTRLGGHFVSGHVDAVGRVTAAEPRGKDRYLRIEPPVECLKFLACKGSIAIDGISLTVAEVDATGFAVWLIPHTLEVTNLSDRSAGDAVNLEFDLLAKYCERLLADRRVDG